MILIILAFPLVKFMQPDMPEQEILQHIGTLDEEQFEGVKIIRFYDRPDLRRFTANYIVGGVININYGYKHYNYKGSLQHELKHHYCWKKDKYLGHKKCFIEDRKVYGKLEKH